MMMFLVRCYNIKWLVKERQDNQKGHREGKWRKKLEKLV